MSDKTVLVADDNRLIRMLVKTALNPLDVEVIEAEDGDRAVEAAVALKPDLILLDVIMPGRNGFEVLEALRADAACTGCRVVMLTTAGSAGDLEHGRLSGADDYIVKPFEAKELRNTVAGLLGIHP